MQINTDYWGGADKRQPVSGVYDFEITTYDLKTALNTDFLPLNEELDTSISPWSINPNSGIAGLYYPTFWRVGEENKATGNLERIHDENDVDVNGVPFYFALPEYSGNGGFTFNWTARNGYSQATIQDTTPNNLRDRVYPVTNFDYSRLAYYVQLVVAGYKLEDVTSDSEFWSNGTMTLDNYINNQETRPILGLRFIPYYATYEAYPNDRTQIELLMNSIAKKQPLQSTTAELIGYDVDYIDDFMTINAANVNTSMPTIGTYGIYASYAIAGDGQWATNASDSLKFNYTIDRTNLMIAHCIPGWHVTTQWTGAASIYYRTELRPGDFESYDKLKDYILKEAAYLGAWFCTDATDIATTEPGSTNNWYLGEIGEDGITTGHYEQGADTANLDNSTWGDNPWEDSGWKGRSDDPNPYDKNLQSNVGFCVSDPSRGTADYLMTGQALDELIGVLTWYKSAEAAGDVPEGTCVTLFGTTDPFECISSIIMFPLDLTYGNWGGAPGNGMTGTPMAANQGVYVGNTELVCTTDEYDPGVDPPQYLYIKSYNDILAIDWYNSVPLYHSKIINYFQRYHSFLDYEPYCSAELYIPFCGSVKIDPELFVGHSISVGYNVSPTEGSVRADIYRDALVVDTVTGNMGVQINFTSSDVVARNNAIQQQNATIQAQKANVAKSLAQFALGTAATLATGGAAGAATTALTAKRGIALGSAALGAAGTLEGAHRSIQAAEYQIKNAETPYKQLLSGAGFLSAQCFEPAIRLVIYRPTFLDGYTRDNFGDYGHDVGFACLKFDTLNHYSGLTVCSSADLTGVAATAKEIEIIKQALQTGVYLPAST